jgi:hypothetical protein
MQYENDELFLDSVIQEIKMGTMAALGVGAALLSSPGNFAGQSRGIRNNNPGNIKKSSEKWNGAVGDDGTFVKFATPADGIRALARIIRVYNEKYKLDTIEQIIHRWAPKSENETGKYIDFVSKKMGKNPKEKIDFKNLADFSRLISAIIQFENHSVPYPDSVIDKGIAANKVVTRKKPS